MCFVYHSRNYLRNILNIPLHFGRLKRYIADVSIIVKTVLYTTFVLKCLVKVKNGLVI